MYLHARATSVEQHDGPERFIVQVARRDSIQAEGIRRDLLVGEDAPDRSNSQTNSKKTDSTFFIQVAAAASSPSQLVYHSSDYSTFMPTLVTVRFGPSNGGQTTV
jgi:hypothetical protein